MAQLHSSYQVTDNVELFAITQNLFNNNYATFGIFGDVTKTPLPGVTDPSDPRFVTLAAPVAMLVASALGYDLRYTALSYCPYLEFTTARHCMAGCPREPFEVTGGPTVSRMANLTAVLSSKQVCRNTTPFSRDTTAARELGD